MRNRIMAALAAITVVVEAAQPSGSLITARQALDLGRELGAVPGPVTSRVVGGDQRPDRRRRGADPRRAGRSRPAARCRCRAASGAAAPRSSRSWRVVAEAVELGSAPATPWRRPLGSPASDVTVALARLELLGYVRGDAGRSLLAHDAEPRPRRLRRRRHSTLMDTWPQRVAIPACLSIAGSDSGGGAGIQADLKAFARCGVHGMTAITALTAQNTVGVEMVTPVPPEMIVAQVRAVAGDIGVDAVKVGMLGDEPTIDAVVEALELVGDAPVVVDPVMVSAERRGAPRPERQGGADRARPPAARPWRRRTCPRRASSPASARSRRPEELARAIQALGPTAVIVTGGHAEEGADVLFDGAGTLRIDGPRYPRRRVARLRLHALVGARGLPRPRHRAGRRGPLGAGDRRRGRGQRPARARRRDRPRRRLSRGCSASLGRPETSAARRPLA